MGGNRGSPAALGNRPAPGAVTVWETGARITHDGTRLLVAIEAQDNEPDRVVASRGARDSVGNEDFVTVLIDAEGSQQRHFVFRVNAAGVLGDEIVGRGNNGSPEWSGTWEAVARRTDTGYSVEMSIPLSTLNASIQQDGGLQLAINVERRIGRDRRETLAMAPVDTTNVCQECQYQVMALESANGPRQFLEVRPYVTTRRTSHFPEFGEDDVQHRVRWRRRPALEIRRRTQGGGHDQPGLFRDRARHHPVRHQSALRRLLQREPAVLHRERLPVRSADAAGVHAQHRRIPSAAAAYVAQGQKLQAAVIAAVGSHDRHNRCGPGRLAARQHGPGVAEPARPRTAHWARRVAGSAC